MTLESYTILFILSTMDYDLLNKYVKICSKISTESIEKLINEGYIKGECNSDGKYFLSTLQILPLGREIFPVKEKVSDWIEIWYELWPKGVKSGGYLVKSDPQACQKKMEKFCKAYPNYTKGIIISSTKKYLEEMKRKGFAYCKLAHFFIYKDDVSTLEGLCAQFKESVNKPDKLMGNVEAI